MTHTALIVEDNSAIRQLVKTHLMDADVEVAEASRADEGMHLAETGDYDIVILDITLPGGSGLDVCKRIRARPGYTPIIMLTARDAESDRIIGLELGADDYVTKPFSISELVARVRAQIRRSEATGNTPADQQDSVIQAGNMQVDTERRSVRISDKPVSLTAREFDLLVHMGRSPGRVFTRAELLDAVWGHAFDGYEHTVNSHINRLRSKIEVDATDPEYVQTVWGVGYRFTDRA